MAAYEGEAEKVEPNSGLSWGWLDIEARRNCRWSKENLDKIQKNSSFSSGYYQDRYYLPLNRWPISSVNSCIDQLAAFCPDMFEVKDTFLFGRISISSLCSRFPKLLWMPLTTGRRRQMDTKRMETWIRRSVPAQCKLNFDTTDEKGSFSHSDPWKRERGIPRRRRYDKEQI